MLRSLAALAIGPFLALGSTAAQESEAARLVPVKATVLVRFEPSAMIDLVHAFGPVAGEPVASLDAQALLGGLQIPGDPRAIDVKRPLFLAVTLEPASPGPVVTWVVPVTDAKTFQAPLGAMGGMMKSAALGAYVGVSMQPDYAPVSAPSPLVAGLRPGVVSVHADLSTLLRVFRPMIDMGLEQAQAMVDSMPPDPGAAFDMQPMMESYFAGMRTVLDSAQSLALTVERKGSRVSLVTDFTARPGSALDGWETSTRADLTSLAGLVDPSQPFQMLLAFDWQSLRQRFGGFLETMTGVYPEPLRAELERLLAMQMKMAELLQPGLAASFEVGVNGLRGSYALRSERTSEVQALFEELAATMLRPEGVVRLDQPGRMKVEGTEARTWKVSFDWERLTQGLSHASDAPAAEVEKIRQMFETLYGKELRVALATRGDVVLLAFGNGEGDLRASLGRLHAPAAPSPNMTALLQRTGGGTPSLAYHVDVGRAFGRIASVMSMLEPSSFSWPDRPFAFDTWGSVRGALWSGGMSMDLNELIGLIGAIKDSNGIQSR